jgi:hypothetical protein
MLSTALKTTLTSSFHLLLGTFLPFLVICRGYGPAVSGILKAIWRGADYRKTATMAFKEGLEKYL